MGARAAAASGCYPDHPHRGGRAAKTTPGTRGRRTRATGRAARVDAAWAVRTHLPSRPADVLRHTMAAGADWPARPELSLTSQTEGLLARTPTMRKPLFTFALWETGSAR